MTTNTAQAVPELMRLLQSFERPDLLDRTKAAAIRANRGSTVVCVVGEFKQGKSSLVNALVRSEVCPVDDDLATSVITLVQYGEQASATVRQREGEQQIGHPISVAEVGEWASEQGNPGNTRQVERVDISVPSSLLKDGLMLVDTPGMGGLGGGHAAATMAFLPFADGLVLVSDASSELTAPEIRFLRQAIDLCPTVMLAQTKIDLYPEWERIVDLNRRHLETQGISIPVVAVSSHLRTTALATKNKDLNRRSNFPAMVDVLQKRVIIPARDSAADRSAADLRGVTTLLRTGAEAELRLLESPEELEEALAKLEQSKARLEHLRGPGAKWSQLMGDRISDLSSHVSHQFRGDMRSIGRTMDELVEASTKGADWEALTRDAQTRVSEATARAYGAVQQGWVDTHREIAEMLQAEELMSTQVGGIERPQLDLSEFWQGTEVLQKDENKGLAGVRSVMGIGQSYSSSKMLLTSVGGLSKFGVSLGALAAGPALAGGFAVMGGIKVYDDRKKQLTSRKQKARTQIRAFIDNVQFEANNEIAAMVRDAQRGLRDEFMSRIGELQQTYTETAMRAQADAKRSEEQVQQRRAGLEQGLAALSKVEATLAEKKRPA